MKKSQSTTHWPGMALACCVIAATVSAEAKKPPKPPPEPPPAVDTGIIYAQIEGDVYAINPDGSEQQYLFSPPAEVDAVRIVASRMTHNGERWFVGWEGIEGTYLDGVSDRFRLIAMSESGAVVTLHDDVMLQPSQGPSASLRWMPGDTAVSWMAMRWEGGSVVEWGVYSLDMEFTAPGSVVAGEPILLDWTSGLFELWYEPPGGPYLPGYYLLACDHDFSPDGNSIVYTSYSEADGMQLYIADDAGGVTQLTSDAGVDPGDAQWSPDGTRIVFSLAQHQIDVIDLVEAERYTLAETDLADNSRQVFLPMWSPNATHVVYCDYTYHKRKGGKDELRVIEADGSGDTSLTDSHTFVHPLGWRAEE